MQCNFLLLPCLKKSPIISRFSRYSSHPDSPISRILVSIQFALDKIYIFSHFQTHIHKVKLLVSFGQTRRLWFPWVRIAILKYGAWRRFNQFSECQTVTVFQNYFGGITNYKCILFIYHVAYKYCILFFNTILDIQFTTNFFIFHSNLFPNSLIFILFSNAKCLQNFVFTHVFVFASETCFKKYKWYKNRNTPSVIFNN